ncbi:MAG: 3-deoxy-7-phosphoheptulonate synthase [Actinomycetota bacterium]
MTKKPILKSHRRPGIETTVVSVRSVKFGDGSYPVIAGPLAVESEEQIISAARTIVEAGGSILRAGTFLAGSSPYGFRGLGTEALWMLEHAGRETRIPVSTEILEPDHVELVAGHVDMIEVGPDNMQNFVLLRAAGDCACPVVIHRAPAGTIDEWLLAAEYVLDAGNPNVILCERGSRGFDPRTSETLDITAIPTVQRLSHLPVIVAPATAAGHPELVQPLALAARGAGADGLVVPLHPDPPNARAGNGSHLDPERFAALMDALGIPSMRDEIDRIDRQVIRLLGRRLRSSVDIAKIKAERELSMRSPDREAELIAEMRADAEAVGMDPDYAQELMELVLKHSRAAQQRAVGREAPGE